MPDANGNFKGIFISKVPGWMEKPNRMNDDSGSLAQARKAEGSDKGQPENSPQNGSQGVK